ncbi:uncharacterized protein [Chironomus tepperi]
MDEMILHCNQNTVYVLNTSYTNYGEFDMIGLFGTQTAGYRRTTNSPSAAAFKSKSKATNMLLDNQINDKLKEVNNNLIKKRPHFLKFFHDSLFKANSIESDSSSVSPKNSCKSTKLTSSSKSSQKSSKELYREAAQILGITCEFDESCRCIECQSRYFDCDDDESDDTFSNLSALIDSDDFLTHVDTDGFYCNGNDENCNYGYTVEGTCNSDNDDDAGCVSVVVNE